MRKVSKRLQDVASDVYYGLNISEEFSMEDLIKEIKRKYRLMSNKRVLTVVGIMLKKGFVIPVKSNLSLNKMYVLFGDGE